LIFFSFSGGVNALEGINFCTNFKADEIITSLFSMAVRYNDTNPIDTIMMIKIMVDSNGLLLFCGVKLEISSFTPQNNNINLGISGFGIGIPNNLCCIQTIQITI
jgi:hypothetical protein